MAKADSLELQSILDTQQMEGLNALRRIDYSAAIHCGVHCAIILSVFQYGAGIGTLIHYRKDAHEAGEDCLEVPRQIKKGTGSSALRLIAFPFPFLKAVPFLVSLFVPR